MEDLQAVAGKCLFWQRAWLPKKNACVLRDLRVVVLRKKKAQPNCGLSFWGAYWVYLSDAVADIDKIDLQARVFFVFYQFL